MGLGTDYIREWTQYRKLRNQLLLVLVGYFLLAAALFIVLPVARFDIVFRAVNFCWLVLLVVAVTRLRRWMRTAIFRTFRTTGFKFSYRELWELPTAKILGLDVCKSTCPAGAFIVQVTDLLVSIESASPHASRQAT